MVRNYRAVQQWNSWLTHFLGVSILEIEQNFLAQLLSKIYSKHALLLGVPQQQSLLKSSGMCNNIILSPLVNKNKYVKYIECEFSELPIIPASIDIVVLPHTLEYIDSPRQLLNEACRVVKPEGDIIIFGFNPYSFWGLKKLLDKDKNVPWSGRFIEANVVKQWLHLADFELIHHAMLSFRPPIQQQRIYNKLEFLEWIGSKCHLPCGNIYVLVAKAKTIALTPLRLHWKQQLSGISVTVPGQTMRDIP